MIIGKIFDSLLFKKLNFMRDNKIINRLKRMLTLVNLYVAIH